MPDDAMLMRNRRQAKLADFQVGDTLRFQFEPPKEERGRPVIRRMMSPLRR